MTKSLPPCHHSLLIGNFYLSQSLYTLMFSLMSFTFDFSNHFTIPMTKSPPPCHHSLLIGSFHLSESLFTSTFTFSLSTFDFTYQLRLMMWIVFCNGTVFFLDHLNSSSSIHKTKRISRLSLRWSSRTHRTTSTSRQPPSSCWATSPSTGNLFSALRIWSGFLEECDNGVGNSAKRI